MAAVPNEDPPPHTIATSLNARGKRAPGEQYGKSSTAKRLASGLDAWASEGAVSSRAEEDGDEAPATYSSVRYGVDARRRHGQVLGSHGALPRAGSRR